MGDVAVDGSRRSTTSTRRDRLSAADLAPTTRRADRDRGRGARCLRNSARQRPSSCGSAASNGRGFLRCDSAAGVCREALPPEPGELALVEVTVEDYAGNAAKRQQ